MANSKKLQSTKPGSIGLLTAVASSLARHVLTGQHVAVGISGGVDSVALLHALAELRIVRQSSFELSAIHVNHALSPNAPRWESFCRAYCERLAVPLICERVQVDRASGDGLESAARRARHAIFAKTEAEWVMLAHHRDDQAETLLFNLLRGTGTAGAGAMRERNGNLLRPLLATGRDEIVDYAGLHKLEWIEDESNADPRHSRNFLRKKTFPVLTQRFPAAAKNMASAAARFAEAHDLLDELASLDLGGGNDFPVYLEKLKVLDERRARNVLRFLLSRRGVRIPSESRLREGLRQMLTAADDRHPVMEFDQHRLLRRRGWLYLESFEEFPASR
jgi:tRNA(Ile)-lysidine synthase